MAAALAFGPFRVFPGCQAEGLESKKKTCGAFRVFPGCQTARLERKKKSFCLPWPSRQKTLAVLGPLVCSLAMAGLAMVGFGRGCWKWHGTPKACEAWSVWGRQWKGSTPKVVPGAALAMAKPGSADIGIQTMSGRYPFIAKFMRIQRLRWRIAQPSCQVELPKPVVISSDIAWRHEARLFPESASNLSGHKSIRHWVLNACWYLKLCRLTISFFIHS